ncbi:lipopolysaccharide biosynthesis protein [Pseudarthrobacter sp. L19]|uniref:lipopolysaccharide biosynthesis protein n=1 Tax=Pseudarthrobacter sp. L19 TaxID=3423951 RepID=UPI003D7A17FE
MVTATTTFRKVVRSPWGHTLAAYGTSQGVLAAGAFARIPLLVSAVAVSGYGSIVAFSGLCVIVIAVADGLAQTSRVMVAERATPNYGRYNRLLNLARSLSVAIFLLFVILAIIAACYSPDLDNPWVAAFCCLAFSSTSLLGGPAKGLLEATGKTAQVHLLQTSTTLIGLPLLLAALALSKSLVVASAVTGLGLALPYLCYLVVAQRILRSKDVRVRKDFYLFSQARRVKEIKPVLNMTVWTWANSLNYAFDAAIVGVVAGATAAGEFGLASRVMTLAMLLSLALSPLITARVSSWRTERNYSYLIKKVTRLTFVITVASLILSATSVAVGPWLEGVLSQHKIASPFTLYAALAVFATASASTAPLMALFAGVGGARFRARAAAALAIVNITLSILFTILWGPPGPVFASTLTLFVLAGVLVMKLRSNPSLIMERY